MHGLCVCGVVCVECNSKRVTVRLLHIRQLPRHPRPFQLHVHLARAHGAQRVYQGQLARLVGSVRDKRHPVLHHRLDRLFELRPPLAQQKNVLVQLGPLAAVLDQLQDRGRQHHRGLLIRGQSRFLLEQQELFQTVRELGNILPGRGAQLWNLRERGRGVGGKKAREG